jgi:hypothetical protein
MILDIDKPKSSGSGLLGLFKKKDTRPPKEQIFDTIRQFASMPKYKECGFRIYETYQGARVIVSGRDFDTGATETKRIMDEFNCDPLYSMLCVKQGCYRARLTPKPYRMNMRRYKVQFPREGNDADFQQWLAEYERESRSFNTCRFIEQVGARHSISDVVQLHDEITGANFRQPLA